MSKADYLERVRSCRCVVCAVMGMTQSTPTVAHHVESVRDDVSDFATAALCDSCHKTLHRLSRRGFEARYKLTAIDLLALTTRALDRQEALHE